MKQRIIHSVLGALVGAIVVFPMPGSADGTFSGSACIPLLYSDAVGAVTADEDLAVSGGVATHYATSGIATFQCNAERDTFATNPAINGWVSIVDGHSSLNSTCTLFAAARDLSVINADPRTTSGTGAQILTFSNVTSGANYFYAILCDVSAQNTGMTQIVAYHVNEV